VPSLHTCASWGEAAFHIEIINNDSPEQKAALPVGDGAPTTQIISQPILIPTEQMLNSAQPITSKVYNLKVVPNQKPKTQ
jgi:hypothetical protein